VTAAEYWTSHELASVNSLGTLIQGLRGILEISNAQERKWVFRGVADPTYPLHSKLFRLVQEKSGAIPDEAAVAAEESAILHRARAWNLDRHRSGPLTALQMLAALQHTDSPTRLIDVTHHALVAAWFAVEKHDDRDGRIFAVEVSRRDIDPNWESAIDPFWDSDPPDQWESDFWVWTPPPVEDRIARQHGAFLIGGVPNNIPNNWYLYEDTKRRFRQDTVRNITSIAAKVNKGGRGRVADRPMRTFRIDKEAKATLRWQLDTLFDLSHRTLFPDLAGFAKTFG